MIKSEIPFKACIEFSEKSLSFSGPIQLQNKINAVIRDFGKNPVNWPPQGVVDGYDILLNEFILKCQNNYKIPYKHDEICHCRMVQTEKVLNTIKQDLFSVAEIGRVTMAGTGCGSCKKDIDDLLNYLIK